jgi:FkbM family methyltransferase
MGGDQGAAGGVVEIRDGEKTYRFRFLGAKERRRAQSIFEKEPGTVDWIRREVRPDDIFYDIGANIGVYSILAGCALGERGRLYCFEPHIPNAASLLENIFLNGLEGKSQLVTIPLSSGDEFRPFNYFSVQRASSTSQFGVASSEGQQFAPVFTELKFGTSLDRLIERKLILPPTIVKIDVDGLEAPIISGMRNLLTGPNRPRSIQVEIGRHEGDLIVERLREAGYAMAYEHLTRAGREWEAEHPGREYHIYNGVFAPS